MSMCYKDCALKYFYKKSMRYLQPSLQKLACHHVVNYKLTQFSNENLKVYSKFASFAN